jgi:hypothetical protein
MPAREIAKFVPSIVVFAAALLCDAQLASAQFVQQGSKLVGTNSVGTSEQGFRVALSADGNTAIVGGPCDNSSVNCSNGSFTGAAWIFIRKDGIWTQQGSKLVGTGAVDGAEQGYGVALSADGDTAIVGGACDNAPTAPCSGAPIEATWVFTRKGGIWTQQGPKLIGTGAVGGANQGNSVAVSGDGNTFIVGGSGDNSDNGAAWVFTRSGGVWTQRGSKLVGTGGAGVPGHTGQGGAVALSADGNTAIVGGPNDTSFTGAAWVFTRSGGVWTQQGSKLVGTGAIGQPRQGSSVAVSADGNTAVIAGSADNGDSLGDGTGAVWVFTRTGGVWTQQGAKLVGTGRVGYGQLGASVAVSANGNTFMAGAPCDNPGPLVCNEDGLQTGAVWVFTRSGGVWTQQGSKLVGTGAVGGAHQGSSVALSAKGDTAIIGGRDDSGFTGATWVFAEPTLRVTPRENIAASGIVGKPSSFAPKSFKYEFSTEGPGSVTFAISGIPSWLNASLTSGTVMPSLPLTVTFTLQNVGGLARGTYEGTIEFTNTTDGRGSTTTKAVLRACGGDDHDRDDHDHDDGDCDRR